MSSDTELLTETHESLRASLSLLDDAVDDHTRRVAEATADLQAARDSVVEEIRRYGAATKLNDVGPDLELARTIYWQHPQVPVEPLAALVNVKSAGMVYDVVGPSGSEQPCKGDCGTVFTQSYASRTAAKTASFWCEACTGARKVAWEAAHYRALRPWESEEGDQAERDAQAALSGGIQPARTYVEFAGVQGTFLVEGGNLAGAEIARHS